MAKIPRIAVVCFFVGIVGLVPFVLLRLSEPVYQGKPLSSWLKDMENWNGNTNDAAFMAFRDMGSNAIPPLLRVLQSGGGRFRHMVMAVNDKQSVVQLPFGKPWEQSMAAARGLYAMGSNARPALPALTNLLFHSNETITSAIAMAGIGTDALPILLSALSNQNYRIRIAAVSALGEERSDLEIVVPALIGSLRDTNQLVHWSAATSLGQLHAEPDIAVPALMNDFPSNDKQLRSGILIALGQFENKARKAIPMILEALKDSDNNVSNCAVFALRQIDPAAAANAGIK